jgi:hypothetical protein
VADRSIGAGQRRIFIASDTSIVPAPSQSSHRRGPMFPAAGLVCAATLLGMPSHGLSGPPRQARRALVFRSSSPRVQARGLVTAWSRRATAPERAICAVRRNPRVSLDGVALSTPSLKETRVTNAARIYR